jgi:hypothetical protein
VASAEPFQVSDLHHRTRIALLTDKQYQEYSNPMFCLELDSFIDWRVPFFVVALQYKNK